MNAFKIFIASAVLLCVAASCKKHVLDKGPLDVIREEDVWKDFNLGQAYVNEIYAALPGSIERDLDGTTEIEDGNKDDTWTYAAGEVTAFNSPLSEAYPTYYAVIARINKFLENFDPENGEEEAVNGLRGEALFLRAFFYRELNDLFGGVPIIKEVQNLDDDLLVSRNTYDECVDFILSDLDQAAGLLPDPADAEIGRANRGAALALKSRVLLYAASLLHNPGNDMEKWQAASDAALEVINGFNYALYPNYNELFLNDNNEEVIFDIQYQFPFRTTANDYTLNPQGLNGAFGNSRPTQNLVDSYEMTNGKSITDPTSGYDPGNPYENRDERFYGSVLYNGVEWRGVTIETFNDGLFGPGVYDTYSTGAHMTGYYIRKFLSENEETNPIIFQDYRADQNWILIRYAEILLNYAEAQLNLGNEEEARDYINMVRERAHQPALGNGVSGDDLVERYMNERKIELAFEEHHYFDIRRWKTAPDLHGGPVYKMVIENDNGNFAYSVEEMDERVWNDAYYYLPIPQDEIDRNENLEQNSGY
ncbi:MAG: RagB/SusD family nutrient uptake outer membrane protein [Chitinophagaceae bacterium]|nr:RagB/SusD family nutrient uptake outer membrane protein [Chitinophagaceae bacterium]